MYMRSFFEDERFCVYDVCSCADIWGRNLGDESRGESRGVSEAASH